MGLSHHPRSNIHTDSCPIYRDGALGVGVTRPPWAIEQPGSREHIEDTFRDDAPIWELNVLRAAAGDQGHRWELA